MVQRKTQLEWTELSVAVLEDRAKEAGLLGQQERLVYSPPSRAATLAPVITAYTETRPSVHQHYWIPQFRPKDTNRDVERICDAQGRILYALILQRSHNSILSSIN